MITSYRLQYSVLVSYFKTIYSSGYPSAYVNGVHQSWTLYAGIGNTIRIKFRDFHTEKCCDHVRVSIRVYFIGLFLSVGVCLSELKIYPCIFFYQKESPENGYFILLDFNQKFICMREGSKWIYKHFP